MIDDPLSPPAQQADSAQLGPSDAPPAQSLGRPGWDALLLAVLLIARLRINSFAEATLYEHFKNVTNHSILGRLLSDRAEAAFSPWFGDPIFLLLAALSLAALIVYLIVDTVGSERSGRSAGAKRQQRIKLALIWLIIALTCLLYTSPSPRDRTRSRMPSSA